VSSVLVCWAVGLAATLWFARSQSWTEEQARRDGVFLFHELLDEVPGPSRVSRLRELQQHSGIAFSLVPLDEVEQQIGRSIQPGEKVLHKASEPEEWYFLVFRDGQGALAAGPVNPARPSGVVPVGIIFAIVGLPVIAGLVALRVERSLTPVERASEALAVGQLDARVEERGGRSDELATRFNAMAERVEWLIRSRDELVQAVSHELGSPLSRLRFHMELLRSGTDTQLDERLHAMTRELDALDELVGELLGYVQSDEVEIERQAFDPRQVLRDLAELARLDTSGERSIEVDIDLAMEIRVSADQRLFQRAVENLLRNAVQHAHGKVLLQLTQDERHVRVAVHDDGPGIPEELRDKVLIPFFRIATDRGRRTGGAGLGLAIVTRILHHHGGDMAIEGSPLGGAMVVTSWPRRD
jgi:two-component system OmpR family sensor kinase